MMKLAIAALATCGAVSACGAMRHYDASPTISRTYRVGNFHEIEIAGPYDVDVRTGDTTTVSGRGSEKVLDSATVETEGDKLVIQPRDGLQRFTHLLGEDGDQTKFVVTVPQLGAAKIAGSGDLRIDNVRGPNFYAIVAGSGGLYIGSLDVGEFGLEVGGSGDVKVGSGTVQSATYEIASSGDVDTRGASLKQLNLTIASSGDVRAHVTGLAHVSIRGSGDVELRGGAQCTVERAGSGDVHCS